MLFEIIQASKWVHILSFSVPFDPLVLHIKLLCSLKCATVSSIGDLKSAGLSKRISLTSTLFMEIRFWTGDVKAQILYKIENVNIFDNVLLV